MVPLVSVVLPAFNAASYLEDALASVLNQTFADFELVFVDDGSTDGTDQIVDRFEDSRIQYYRNATNRGVVESLNIGIERSHGEFVARMDADDIASPRRLAVQVAFLHKHPEFVACGTWFRGFDSNTVVRTDHNRERIRAGLLFNTQLAHPTTVIRRSALSQLDGPYDPQMVHAEDYDLWTRLAEIGWLTNLRMPLLRYRSHESNISSKHQTSQRRTVQRIAARQLTRLGIEPSPHELVLHSWLEDPWHRPAEAEREELAGWCGKIIDANTKSHYASRWAMREVLVERMLRIDRLAREQFALRHRVLRARQVYATPR